MKDEARLLEDKFTEILNWERAKRREASLLWSFCYAVVSSLIALPVSGLIAPGVNPMWFPVVFFGGLALARLLLNPWSRADSAKALLRLDKSLALEERAITAWDILGRKTPRPAERLVLEEAWQKLETADPKLVLRRDPGWTAAAAPLLLVVWLFAAWFQDELSIKAFSGGSQAASVAQSAKEYARSLQQKSKAEGLRESLKAARALEELAEKRLRRESGERAFLDSLSQLMKGVEARAGSPSYEAAAHLAAPTRQGLADLRSEIESLRESLKFPGGVGGDGKLGSEVLERLAGLPQLRKEVETAFKQGKKPESEKMAAGELQELLNKLEKSATEELDRMALEDLSDFLASVSGGGEREDGGDRYQSASRGDDKGQQPDSESKGAAEMPGHQPGSGEPSDEAPQALALNPSSHLKGLLREGETRSAVVKGAGRVDEAHAPRSDVTVSYSRQVEEELASEEIPDAMKETIRKYFLSLGMGKDEGRR